MKRNSHPEESIFVILSEAKDLTTPEPDLIGFPGFYFKPEEGMKKKIVKRISLIITLSMLFSLVISPLSYGEEVFLADDPEYSVNSEVLPDGTVRIFEDDEEDEDEHESDPSLPQPDANGLLNLSLTEVPEYGYYKNDNIKKVVFQSGIKNVKKGAFKSCHNLEEVIFPEKNTLKRIFWSAFEDCPKLRRFICPDTIVKDGVRSGCECDNRVLYGCSALEELKLGTGMWHFGVDSFYGAEKLTSVTLPSDLHNINGNIFRGCTNLKSIEIYSDKNTYFESRDGVLYEKINPYLDQERKNNDMIPPILYAVPTGKVRDNGGSFKVPANTTTIGPRAFYGDKALKEVIISAGNERLCQSVFEGCENLTTVVWPKSLKNVGTDAFLDCTSLTTILYTGSESDWNNIQADFYKHSINNEDNHKNVVSERKPLKDNMSSVGLSENMAISFNYVNKDDLTLAPGSRFDVAAYIGTKGQKGIKYTSSNKKYVKVSGKGLCTIKKGSGDVTVTAIKKKEKSTIDSVVLRVVKPEYEKKTSGAVGGTISGNTAILKGCEISPKWYSSKKSVAEVNEDTGEIKLLKKGKAKIYMVFNGASLKDKNGTKKKYKTTVKVTE